MIKGWLSHRSELTNHITADRTNHPISIRLTAALGHRRQNEMCIWVHACVCMNAVLVNLNEPSAPLENDGIWKFSLRRFWSEGERTKRRGEKCRGLVGGASSDRKVVKPNAKKKKWDRMKSGVAGADRGGTREEREIEKAKMRWRETEQERVSMFETSHWFLLSGTLVSQELDCSTLPLTDSWPAV